MKIETGRYIAKVGKYYWEKKLLEIEVIEVSDTSIKFRYVGGITKWLSKKDFKSEFNLFERLTDNN